MGKYRLKSKQKGSVITLMEVDTECQAWYIQADDRNAALQVLKTMSDEIRCLRNIYLNGNDVTEEVCPLLMTIGDASLPEEEFSEMYGAGNPDVGMDMHRTEDSPEGEADSEPVFKLPSIRDVQAAMVAAPPVEDRPALSQTAGISFSSELPSLESVLPASAFQLSASGEKRTDGILLGRSHIKGKISDISTIREEQGGIVVQGTVIDCECRDLRENRCLFTMKLADETDGILCKKFFEKKEDAQKLTGVKKNMTVKVRGNVQLDKFTGGLVLNISQMEQGKEKEINHEDMAETPRVELHLHTKMSLDGLIDNEEIIRTAAKWKHPAVAITDHGVIQAFPQIQTLAAKYGQKVIYGMEGYLIDEVPEDIDSDRQQYSHIILLAKNITGLRNLYRLVTLSHLKYYRKRPLLPRPLLEEFRDGLMYGSACVMGEFFRAVLNGDSDEELIRLAKFYDYLEVQPLGNNEFLLYEDKYAAITTKKDLQELNKKVIEIGEKAGIPICATSDAHYLFAEYARDRDILLSNWEKPGKIESHPPVYLRTTEEMLEEFSYLPKEKAEEIVITNTRRVAEQCEVIEPLAEEWKSYNPKIAGADDKLKAMCYEKAVELYGEPLPEIIRDRLDLELTPIINHGYGVLYYIAHKLVKHSNDRGYLVGSRGSVGSSFVATLAGITEVNPLPPHYVCPHCHWNQFFTDGSVGGGFDLADKKCPNCGTELNKDGHNIPFAVFLGFDGDKVPDIDLNFSSGDDQAVAHKYTEELFGRDNVFRAGTIAGIQDKTAFGFVKRYAENRGLTFNDIFIEKLSAGVAGVKRTTGQHPAGIMVCPRDMDIHNFTPLQYAANKRWLKDETGEKIPGTITTHFDYHSISGRMLKLDILGHDDPKVIRMLQDITGIDPLHIPFNDEKTLSLFSSPDALGITSEQLKAAVGDKGITVGAIGLPEFGTPFVRGMLEDTRPKNFSELVRISGFSHGTNVWLNNARDLITSGKVKLEEAISTRDDIMNYLIEHHVKPLTAFKVMENVRKGNGLEKGNSNNRKELEDARVPQWFIDSCLKISYLFPRAHAVAYVMMAFRIAWFKVHEPLAFYATFFTVRAKAFDAEYCCAGLDAVKRKIREIENNKDATAVEQNLMVTLEVCYEFYLRGFHFDTINIYESQATAFKITDNGLLPPFISVRGLGETAAQDTVEKRKGKTFISVEEFSTCCSKLSKTHIEQLKALGAFAGMADTSQITLFG